MKDFIVYKKADLKVSADNGDIVTVFGPSNEKIVFDLMFVKQNDFITIEDVKIREKNKEKLRKTVNFATYDRIDIFVAETVRDEIASGMENLGKSKREMQHFLSRHSSNYDLSDVMDRDPYSLGVSDKVKLKIVSALACDCHVLVLLNVLENLDYNDYVTVERLLKDYTALGNIVINFTTNIEESLIGNKIIITSEDKVLVSGSTLSVLNEEKLLKRLKVGLPFIVELNKYLMDYGIVNKYILNYKELVDAVWK